MSTGISDQPRVVWRKRSRVVYQLTCRRRLGVLGGGERKCDVWSAALCSSNSLLLPFLVLLSSKLTRAGFIFFVVSSTMMLVRDKLRGGSSSLSNAEARKEWPASTEVEDGPGTSGPAPKEGQRCKKGIKNGRDGRRYV